MYPRILGWLSEKKDDFERVPNADEAEEFLADEERASQHSQSSRPTSHGPSWLVTVVITIATAVLSASFGAWAGRTWILNPNDFSIRHTSQYSPIIKDVGVEYHTVRFNGSLLKSNVFRQDAGPEVDAAWKSLGADYHAARIPFDQAAQSNIAPDQVKIKEKYGGGYPAHVEGLHHLHCLNLLRKSLAWNFNYYSKQGLGPFSNPPDIAKYHITHCLDILRQQLTCTIDVGMLGQVWYQPPDKPPQAFVDFNTEHKCRNFEDIREWARAHQLPDKEHMPEDFLEQPKEGDRVWKEVP
ncbi:hypothetical protein P154DRAFT_594666 [Amniculicola lignicola CBS 123094]|uniref:Tat pathway signal sequence n=1 Tax=Amniculicola lignicola CBS 123094 TaxID=1392246 RepID=A0A6A5WLC2_9PLEO|nr:hypothetical protein P154DRAFT_594666 [Amniculicola lignicola CBS 123094]